MHHKTSKSIIFLQNGSSHCAGIQMVKLKNWATQSSPHWFILNSVRINNFWHMTQQPAVQPHNQKLHSTSRPEFYFFITVNTSLNVLRGMACGLRWYILSQKVAGLHLGFVIVITSSFKIFCIVFILLFECKFATRIMPFTASMRILIGLTIKCILIYTNVISLLDGLVCFWL